MTAALRVPLEALLNERLTKQSPLLMTHMVVGYPSLEANWRMLEIMESEGSDVVELQFPFSEPTADGPLFVKANQAALDTGIRVQDCLDFMTRACSRFTFPILMMGYYNTVMAKGEAAFCSALAKAGAAGMIIPDLPPELAGELRQVAREEGLELIVLLTPNADDARLRELSNYASGFVYAVARKGVTGKASDFDAQLDPYLSSLRSHFSVPLALGFGVKSAADVQYLKGKVDMVVVGTAALDAWERGGEVALQELLGSMRSCRSKF